MLTKGGFLFRLSVRPTIRRYLPVPMMLLSPWAGSYLHSSLIYASRNPRRQRCDAADTPLPNALNCSDKRKLFVVVVASSSNGRRRRLAATHLVRKLRAYLQASMLGTKKFLPHSDCLILTPPSTAAWCLFKGRRWQRSKREEGNHDDDCDRRMLRYVRQNQATQSRN